MSLFDDGSGSNDFDGALRERGPKIPPRRRRAPAADAESGAEGASESPAQPKKSSGGGWASGADVGTVPVRSTQPPSTAVGSIAEPGGKEDDDIMVIPDLEEADDDDMTAAVAEPGAVSGAALPTHLEDEQGQLPSSMVDGIDLSLLYEVILPKKQLQVDMGSWDPDAMLNDIKQTMQEEEDKLAE